jgi:hypothetical protein
MGERPAPAGGDRLIPGKSRRNLLRSSFMFAACTRPRKAFALLGTMLFLVVVASFHSAADNDLARVGADSRIALDSPGSGADTCPACALDGLAGVRTTVAPPVGVLGLAERVSVPTPARPFVEPRASVDSRPPPTA